MVTKTGKVVQAFYNKTPFRDYDLSRFNNREDLRISAYPFARILDRSISPEANVIDVGTGTGQLSAFLSLRRRTVVGVDFSDSSLAKANALKKKLQLDSWSLYKMDVLDAEQVKSINQKFDVVLCLGVLHHTGDAYLGFNNIIKLLKPKGLIAIGLYNRYGRIPLKIRQVLAKTIFKNNNKVKDWFIKMQIGDIQDVERARGWWNDQYLHPHETTHTIGEVMNWFKKNGIEFIQTVPSSKIVDNSVLEITGVWNDVGLSKPWVLIRLYQQLKWVFTTHHEGGYWITFGRKQ